MSDDRRGAARILTDCSLVLLDGKGGVIDEHAVAHDLSIKGFRAEMHGDIAENQPVRYRLALDEGCELKGRARIVWVQRTDFALWVGVEFVGLSWADRRLLKKSTSAPTANWMLIATKFLLAVVWIGGLLGFWIGIRSNFWRPQMFALLPKAIAAVALGWALLELLAPDRRDR
ncbi:MAG: PilZ domain-containing protein [Elusimicrobia bacterium]|nr:PilZ domain-containing protein [Elusimicrobiota bacterium]